jgi:Arabinose efflux permease
MTHKVNIWWTFAITSLALFMVTLDNLVVTTAIPVIRRDLHAGLSGLEWTVNAYTLTFAVLLLTGAALGDRFGRRRMFAIGVRSSPRPRPLRRSRRRSSRSTSRARFRASVARS